MRLFFLALVGVSAIIIACLPSCANGADEGALDCQSDSLCEDVQQRYNQEIDVLVQSVNTCETRDDCVSEKPTLGCPDQATWLTTCAQGVRADAVSAFQADVAALEAVFCTECDLECFQDEAVSCTAPIAKCIDGRCVVEFMEDL